MMTWDINRDTDQRMGYPKGANNLYQTGQGKATYINSIIILIMIIDYWLKQFLIGDSGLEKSDFFL